MGEVIDFADDLEQSCQYILGEEGQLSTAISGFIPRAEQIKLASLIAQTIKEKTILVAEAGTGTGKTFAYLIPCLLNKKKTIISTATKTLQDQLFEKDLPLLIKALKLPTRVQNLKGRSNYICRYRTQLHAEESRFIDLQHLAEVSHVREKLPQLKEGVRSELPQLSEDSTVWPYVTSTVDNCLGSECSEYNACFLVKARKKALEADLIVINHHLFFADSRLKEEGFGELLPGAEIIVFDEAHQISDIATHFNDKRFSTRDCRELVNDLLRIWPVLDLVNQPLKEFSFQLDQAIDQLLLNKALKEERVAWYKLASNPIFLQQMEALIHLINQFIECINQASIEKEPAILRCLKRLTELKESFLNYNQSDQLHIRWLERFKYSLVFHATPLDMAKSFSELLIKHSSAYIFTSATLTMASSFDHFIKPLGLSDAKTVLLPSPFNFQEQALLYLPRTLPDPKDPSYYDVLLEKALPVINACGGRCFFLFTSHKALKLVAQRLESRLNFPLLVQGDEAKSILLARFRQLGNAVLLGTATFWEGVDVKGEALSCVIIDKLPFASPMDPITQGKMAYLRSQQRSGFDEFLLPNAVLALKQGIGRLIRDTNDRGVLMIADPRLTGREYGRTIFSSFPLLPKTRDERVVLSFINELKLTHELISH